MSVVAEVSAPAGSVAEVFEGVFARYHGKIRSLFYTWLGDWATAEDLAAEVFTSLWRDMSQRGLELVDVESLYGFLAQRARWAKANYYKAQAARRESLCWPEDEADTDRIEALAAALTTDGPEATTVSRVDLARVISILPDKQHRAILLRYLCDMAPDQVASITGWPPRTVRLHTAGALDALRTAAGLPTDKNMQDRIQESTAERYEAMRQAYLASIEAGEPLTMNELARRFGRTRLAARRATAGITRPVRPVAKQRVEDTLRAELADGLYPPGTAMPTADQIADRFQVNTSTVSYAMAHLRDDGLVVKLTGPGFGSSGRYHAAPAAQLREAVAA
ncbi:MAG TPA: sigma-70 family RNA polymerase sigma factor [Actinocrinis sp.]|nr:sigma-70 family RNA polymerase sigma factor [Actinocrinis sp.]